jgi:aminoglycoside phosphotransferase (APT) family kinase protein
MRPLWLLHINLGPLLHLLAWPRTLVWRWQRRQALAQVNEVAPLLLTTVPHRAGLPAPTTWRVAKILRTVSEMTVAVLATPSQAGVAILKLPQSTRAAASLQRQAVVVATLRAHSALQGWIRWLPMPLATGTVAGRFYLLEMLLPGVDGTRLQLDEQGWLTVQTAACRAISHLHQQTATTTTVEAALLQRWVEEPIATLRRLQPALLTQAEYEQRLHRLQAELTAALRGSTVGVSWIHGDFTPGNILFDPAQQTITGLIDWELAAPDELPQLDLLQFFITTRMIRQQCEYGDVIRTLLTDHGWQEPERLLLATAQKALPGVHLADRTLLLLCWLRHSAASVTKAEQYAHHRWWKIRNLEAVLLALA